jgi:hypothetical protein
MKRWKGRARWEPQTKNDARAQELYDNAIITGIAAALPRVAPGMDRNVLEGLIWKWASKWIGILHGASSHTAKGDRNELKKLAKTLREAAVTLDELPDTVKSRMADLRSGGDSASLEDWARNLDYVRSAREVRELAALADKAAKGIKTSRGRPRDYERELAVTELGEIYAHLTGKRPARFVDPSGERKSGPLEAFVEAALKPLWPNAGKAGKAVKTAVSWYKNKQSNT